MKIVNDLLNIRVKFQELGKQKSGATKHYTYFELDDILPDSNRLFKEAGILPKFDMNTDTATLTLIKGEEQLVFSIDTKSLDKVSLVSQNEIQVLGSKNTYLKRYLYLNVLEISEPDTVEKKHEQSKPGKPEKSPVEEIDISKIRADLKSHTDKKLRAAQIKSHIEKNRGDAPNFQSVMDLLNKVLGDDEDAF